MKFHQQIAEKMKTNHSDTQAVIRSGKRGAKKRTSRHNRQLEKRADERLLQETLGITDSWLE